MALLKPWPLGCGPLDSQLRSGLSWQGSWSARGGAFGGSMARFFGIFGIFDGAKSGREFFINFPIAVVKFWRIFMGWCWNPRNNGINGSQPQLVSRISAINSIIYLHEWWIFTFWIQPHLQNMLVNLWIISQSRVKIENLNLKAPPSTNDISGICLYPPESPLDKSGPNSTISAPWIYQFRGFPFLWGRHWWPYNITSSKSTSHSRWAQKPALNALNGVLKTAGKAILCIRPFIKGPLCNSIYKWYQ